jgi:replicative DNA helicase
MIYIPPSDPKAERAVVGALLKQPDLLDTDDFQALRPSDFQTGNASVAFRAIRECINDSRPVSALSIAQAMAEDVRDVDGLVEYLEACRYEGSVEIVTDTIWMQAERVRIFGAARRGMVTAKLILEGLSASPYQVEQVLTRGVQALSGVTVTHGTDVVTAFEAAKEAYDHLVTEPDGIDTGFDAINRLTCGYSPSHFWVLAARPGMGKTALAFRSLWLLANRGIPCLFLSMEMSKMELLQRLFASEGGVEARRLKTRALTEGDFESIHKFIPRLKGAPLYINDESATTTDGIISRIRQAYRQHGIRVVGVDYLQLVKGASHQSRERIVSECSNALKAVAKDLGITVIALAQLNRSCESREDKRPVMSDLRESGAIEQDADIIGFVYRDEYYYPDGTPQGKGKPSLKNAGQAEVIFRKNRSGTTGTAHLGFDGARVRFDSREAVTGAAHGWGYDDV